MHQRVFNVVRGSDDIRGAAHRGHDVFKYLTVAHLPEDYGQAKDWNPLDNAHRTERDGFVEARWLSVVVADEGLLVEVEDDEGKEGHEVKDRHARSVEEGASNVEQDHRVTIVNQVDWAGVQINVSLGRRHARLVSVAAETAIEVLLAPGHGAEHRDFNEWPKSLDDEG